MSPTVHIHYTYRKYSLDILKCYTFLLKSDFIVACLLCVPDQLAPLTFELDGRENEEWNQN